MTSSTVAQNIRDLFEQTCFEQFLSIDCPLNKQQAINLDLSDVPHARINAGCHDFEIEIHLHLPFSTLAMTYPTQGDIIAVDEVELEDWICELSNMLLGKFKHSLFDYNINLASGLPEYTFGLVSPKLTSAHGEYFSLPFEFDHEVFEVGIYIEVYNEAMVFARHEGHEDSVKSGEIDFF